MNQAPPHRPAAAGTGDPGQVRRRQADPRLPAAPPMQIITKGWWFRPDEEATADELEQADLERQHGRVRRR